MGTAGFSGTCGSGSHRHRGGVTSMEGKDPCHEDELTLERTYAEAPQQQGGLTFDWSGESMVKAFVMQEVLTRPSQRRAR